MTSIEEEIVLELARLQRAAYARVRQRCAEQQLGEAWVDLPTGPAAHAVGEIELAQAA